MNWNKKIRGEVHIAKAIELADSFSDACRAGKPIPAWVLALRALSGSYQRARDYIQRLEAEEEKRRASFEPGSFGFHEFVDRAALIAELFSRELREHPAAKHPKLKKRVKKLESKLYQLYNEAAILHMCGEQDSGSL